MRLPHRGSRFDAEFLDQAGPQVAVDGEGFGPASGAMQHEHQQPVEGLTERMLGDKGGQLRCKTVQSSHPGTAARPKPPGTPARPKLLPETPIRPKAPGTPRTRPRKAQLSLVPPLQNKQPRLREPLDERVPAALGREPAQGRAAPQRQRGRGLPQRTLPIAPGMRCTRGRDVVLEDTDVQLALADAQDVPRRHGPQPFRIVEEAP